MVPAGSGRVLLLAAQAVPALGTSNCTTALERKVFAGIYPAHAVQDFQELPISLVSVDGQ